MKRHAILIGLGAFLLTQFFHGSLVMAAPEEAMVKEGLPCHETSQMVMEDEPAESKEEGKGCCDDEGRCQTGACSAMDWRAGSSLTLEEAGGTLSYFELLDSPLDGHGQPTHGPPKLFSSV